jgi:valyl-tRNA synthetase
MYFTSSSFHSNFVVAMMMCSIFQIQGSDGRKMSKSLGNVIDPCDLMEGKTLKELLDRLKASNLDPKQLKMYTCICNHSSHHDISFIFFFRIMSHRSSAEALTKKDYPNGMQACGADALRMALLMRVNLVC